MEDVKSFLFPSSKTPNVHTLILCLNANGDSSYRDAESLSRLMIDRFNSKVTILSDSPSRRFRCLEDIHAVSIHIVSRKEDCMLHIRNVVSKLPRHSDLLFVISGHGYSVPAVGIHKKNELNGRSECVHVGRTILYDYNLFDALYTHMLPDTRSICLVDTCHSGTMLDLEYISFDGGLTIKRSRQRLCRRPFSICISACDDSELAGEDISEFGGWGGKLVCAFLDYVSNSPNDDQFLVYDFFRSTFGRFQGQSSQREHPTLSFNLA
jgi:hypothetical protein